MTPDHHQSILEIQTTLSVTLARKKIALSDILSLVPGSMMTFEVHCDSPLTLEAAQSSIGTGEAVKIGDKFGLKVRHLGVPKPE